MLTLVSGWMFRQYFYLNKSGKAYLIITTSLTLYPAAKSVNSKVKVVTIAINSKYSLLSSVIKKSHAWVKSHRFTSIQHKDAAKYKLKSFRIEQGRRQIDANVYNEFLDSDCNGCCTKNIKKTGFLIDMEKYTLEQFGCNGKGIVEWRCLYC